MAIEQYYRDLEVYKYTAGSFQTAASYNFSSTFKGLIQAANGSKTFYNGKDTSSINGILFCPKEVTFSEKDIIKDGNTKYKIAGMAGQRNGVAGINPQMGQHCEYNLTYTQEGI